MNQHFDVLVAGAGMVGACAALSLARSGFRVAIIEPAALSTESVAKDAPYDLRVSAISPLSEQILSQLSVWSGLDQNRVCHYEQMSVWHEHGDASVEFDCAQLGKSSLGAIVENAHLLRSLISTCEKQDNIDWFVADKITTLVRNSEQALEVELQSGVVLEADLLLVADGRFSPTRSMAQIEPVRGSYRQNAIVANVDTELGHQWTARQRFLETGPLAFLPLANGQCSIVWSCDQDRADQLINMGDNEFCEALGSAFDYRLGAISGIGKRLSFPLGWHTCERWLKDRVLLIGDAAHGVHPLAGQGVNLGFSDVVLLTELIGGLDSAWDRKKLRQFERRRKSETIVATHMFSALKSLYGTDNDLLNLGRDLGMRLFQSSNHAKRSMMQKATRNML